ncbi:MAG: hypothetical protein ABR499_06215 [Gemmatimonadaceae bacterium]
MRRATPLGHEKNSPAPNQEHHPDTAPAETPVADEQAQFPRPFSVVRGGAPAERPRRSSGEHRRRKTPVRALVQPSDPERLRRALAAMREMNQLTRQRTDEMRKLSVLSRDLAKQMEAFGTAVRGLKIGPQRKSAG